MPLKRLTVPSSGALDQVYGVDYHLMLDAIEKQPYNYFVYKDGSTFKAKNGLTEIVDYSGTDAALVIRNAFGAISSGGVVRLAPNTTFDLLSRTLPPGTPQPSPFIAYAGIHLKSNQMLIGGGPGSTILRVGNGIKTCGIMFEDRSGSYANITIANLTIDGNKANNTLDTPDGIDGNQVGIRGFASSNIVIRNVETKNNIQQGMYWTTCQQELLERVYSHHNGKEGFAIDADQWTTMIECDAFQNDAAGIYMVGGTGRLPSNNTIIGGTIYNNSATIPFPNTSGGINITDCKYDSIIGVRVVRSGYGSLRADNIFISNSDNIFVTDCISLESFRAGILVNASNDIVIRGGAYFNNRFDAVDNAGSGIYLLDTTNSLVIGANSFDNQGTKTQLYGVVTAGTSDNNTIVFNDLRNTLTGPALLVGTNNIVNDNRGYVTEKMGATSVADGGTITHGLAATPAVVSVTPSIASEFASVTAKGTTTFTVAIKKHDNTVGTTQTVYWRASV